MIPLPFFMLICPHTPAFSPWPQSDIFLPYYAWSMHSPNVNSSFSSKTCSRSMMASSVWRTDLRRQRGRLASAAVLLRPKGWQCPFPPWRWIRAAVPLRIVGCTAVLPGSGMRAAADASCPPGMPLARHSVGPFGHRPVPSSGMYADAAAGCMSGSICEISSFVPPYLVFAIYYAKFSALVSGVPLANAL